MKDPYRVMCSDAVVVIHSEFMLATVSTLPLTKDAVKDQPNCSLNEALAK